LPAVSDSEDTPTGQQWSLVGFDAQQIILVCDAENPRTTVNAR
jgi:hypothetical protein